MCHATQKDREGQREKERERDETTQTWTFGSSFSSQPHVKQLFMFMAHDDRTRRAAIRGQSQELPRSALNKLHMAVGQHQWDPILVGR